MRKIFKSQGVINAVPSRSYLLDSFERYAIELVATKSFEIVYITSRRSCVTKSGFERSGLLMQETSQIFERSFHLETKSFEEGRKGSTVEKKRRCRAAATSNGTRKIARILRVRCVFFRRNAITVARTYRRVSDFHKSAKLRRRLPGPPPGSAAARLASCKTRQRGR